MVPSEMIVAVPSKGVGVRGPRSAHERPEGRHETSLSIHGPSEGRKR